VPAVRFITMSNVIEPPRLFWNTVEFITVQAVYTAYEVVLRVQWDDRSHSTGSNTKTEYKDRDTKIYAGTDHPDQMAVQFPAQNKVPAVRPYFMLGDRKRAVNLWWWRADTNVYTEINAKGFNAQTIQPESSQALMGATTFDDGRYTMIIRRALTTDDPKKDVQFKVGDFVPLAFHVWDGERGHLGQRRSLTTWAWLQLKPPIPGHVKYVPYATFGASFVLLFGLMAWVRRKQDAGS
jgi:DMSO reductase family type II enzyme heme b subunit